MHSEFSKTLDKIVKTKFMKKITFILMLTLMSNFVFSQIEKHNEAFKIFQDNYNAGNFENIFNSFSTEMKDFSPLEGTNKFFSRLQLQFGKIQEGTFVKFENQDLAVYKTTFEKGVFIVNLSINELNLIRSLIIKPYIEENKPTRINGLSDFPAEISKIIYAQAKDLPNKTQLSVAVLKNGNTSYYGIIIQNDTIKSIKNQNKIFEIGSITKVFTSSVLASLVVDKKLEISAYINDYYPFSFKDNTKISFLDLANHTSGLPRLPENLDLSNPIDAYKNYKEKELNEYLTKFLKIDNNTKKYDYSNLGAGLLGHTLALSQKKTFGELLEKRIFKKYKMGNTYTNPNGLGSKIVQGLDDNGQVVANWEFDVLFGCGGILSTSEDLVKFAKAQFDKKNKALALTRKPTFEISNQQKIGLGWHILNTKNGFNWIWHNGGTLGYSSAMVLDVEKKNGVVVLSNVSGVYSKKNKNIDNLCLELMKHTE
jgi:CubicO group peptidase (beta-lactamase class C family)